jgi:ABC-2 type transport system permease protein
VSVVSFVLNASLYIIICSARNRMRVRLRRLREPRYLIGAIVGAAYIYFSFFARFRASRASTARRNARGAQLPAVFTTLTASAPAFGGLILMAVATGAWLFPMDSGLLEFSDAEMQFLFPAPVSRRQLLIHRMLRSQLGMLFGSLVIGLVSPSPMGVSRLRISAGVWILLVTGKIYFTGVTLARARLGAGSARIRRVAWLPLTIMLAALAAVGSAIARDVRHLAPGGLGDVVEMLGRVAAAGAPRVILWPFAALVRPLFSAWPQPYLTNVVLALAVMTAITIWVLLSDEAFQEAVSDAAARRSQEPAARKGQPTYSARASVWTLAPAGRPETAFAWKAAMQTLRMVDRRALVQVVSIVASLTIVAASLGRANGLASLLGAFSFAATAFAIVLAPQVVRIDMRQDLFHLELLKTWPVKAAAVVRGELLWPGVIITAGSWAMLAMAMVLSGTILGSVSVGLRMGGGAAIAIVAPALVFAQLMIHNAVALLFPAWVPLGNQRPRGLDAMGQRLIMLGATWLLLIISMLPGAMAGGIVWFALQHFVGAAALVPAALVCTGIVGIEVLAASEAIGPAYERLDVMAVERSE